MKTNLFFFLFMGIHILAFSQGTLTIPNSAQSVGALFHYDANPPWYAIQIDPSKIQIGYSGGQTVNYRGRGFTKFDFTSLPTSIVNNNNIIKG